MEQNINKQLPMPDQERRTKPCLACSRAFVAEGPFLRICPVCKESDEWQSGDHDFALHTQGAANDN